MTDCMEPRLPLRLAICAKTLTSITITEFTKAFYKSGIFCVRDLLHDRVIQDQVTKHGLLGPRNQGR